MEPATELHAAHLPCSADALALMLDRLPVSIAVLRGPQMIYEIANGAYCRLVGHHGIVGCANGDVQSHPITRTIERVYVTGEPFIDPELPLVLDRRGDGRLSKCFFDTVMQPLRGSAGAVAGVMVFAVEVTCHVEARIDAQVKHADALRKNAMRDDFVAIASYELRNPLMAILGWTRILRQ